MERVLRLVRHYIYSSPETSFSSSSPDAGEAAADCEICINDLREVRERVWEAGDILLINGTRVSLACMKTL